MPDGGKWVVLYDADYYKVTSFFDEEGADIRLIDKLRFGAVQAQMPLTHEMIDTLHTESLKARREAVK